MTSPPADGYPDPLDRAEHRYWDGSTWTDHVATGGRQSTDPVDAPPPPGTTAPGLAPAASDGSPPPPGAADRIPGSHDQRVKQQVEGGGYRGASVVGGGTGGP